MNDWIDIRDQAPRAETVWLVATAQRDITKARYTSRWGTPQWRDERTGHGLEVTHYRALPDLPPPPRPIEGFLSGHCVREHPQLVLSRGAEKWTICWVDDERPEPFIDWLNEMWAKAEVHDREEKR